MSKETALYISRLPLQEDLRFGKKGLTALLSEMIPSARAATKLLDSLFHAHKSVQFGELLSNLGADVFFYEIGNPDKFSKEYGVRGSKYFGFSALFIIESIERMKKKSDYLVLQSTDANGIVARNRYDNTAWELPTEVVRPCIRRVTGITKLDFTGKADYTVSRYFKGLSRILRSIYPEKEASFYEDRIKEEWEQKVQHGVSNLCLARRIDLGASGTRLLAVYNDEPMLLVANSWGFRSLKKDYAKVLTLWFNSTLFLLNFLTKRMQTRGTWGQIDRRQLTSFSCPDISGFTQEQLGEFNALFNRLSEIDFPSITEQLSTEFEARVIIDDAFIKSLGVANESERTRIGSALRKAASKQIQLLQRAMSGD